MKIAVLSDVHANYAALEAVVADIDTWQPDHVVVAGDLVNRGPRPRECLALIQQRYQCDGWQMLFGNHEEYVLTHFVPGAPRSGPRFETHRPSYWTGCQLDGHLALLRQMPRQISMEGPSGGEIRFTHASMGGLRDGIYTWTPDTALRSKISPAPEVLCVGHTHRPLVRRLDGTLIVNAGSAGLPFDGDQRASYARLTGERDGWQAEIVRVPYDLTRAERDFYDTGYLDDAGALVRLVYLELQQACGHLYDWSVLYQQRAEVGEISVADAVDEYIAKKVT